MRISLTRLTALSLFLGSCLAPIAGAEEQALAASAADELFAFVKDQSAKLKGPPIAVVPFRHEDGSESMEGQVITEQLLTKLGAEPSIRVVEREYLKKALEEQKLAAEGFISPETAARAGKLTGAGAILVATLTEHGEIVEIHARLFKVETGEVLAAKQVKARRTIKTFINPLWDDIDRIKAAGNRFKAKLWMERDRLRIGDTAVIFFQTERDGYVTIFDFATDGGITVLFPNRYQPNNKVKAGQKYRVPPEDAAYKIRATPPAGIDRLNLFATTKDIQLYVRDYSQAPFSAVTDGDQNLVRSLKVTTDQLEKSDWSESSCEFLIENVLR